MISLEALAFFSLAFWVFLVLDRPRRWPGELRLDRLGPEDEAEAKERAPGRVTIVMPARDESAVLGETLAAVLEQVGVEPAIVLVDDSSTDGTASLAEELARDHPRFRLVSASPTPPGWSGKLHALRCGIERAGDPEWLLFVDADIRLRPEAVRDLLALARAGSHDLVSVMARLHAATFWERLLIPPFVFFFQLLYPFRRVGREDSPVAAAAGGCLLVRREALVGAGGLEGIRGRIIDDVSLAKAVQGAGGRLWLGLDPGVVSVRPYRGLKDLWGMVARTAFTQLGYRWSLVIVTLLALAIFFVSPPVSALVAGGRMLVTPGGAEPAAARVLVWALLAWGLQTSALYPAVRHHRVPGAYAALLPVASLLYGLMTLSSATSHSRGRGSPWKGRTYPAG